MSNSEFCRIEPNVAIREHVEASGASIISFTSYSGGGEMGAAVRCPDRFKSVTLWGSAGTSKHGLLSLLARAPRVGREIWSERDRLQANFEPILGESAKIFVSYLINNALRVAGETVAVTRSNTRETLRLLSREVPTGAMVYQNDGFFKPEEVAKKILGIVHDFRELPNVGHLAPQTHPKEVIAAQLEMLEIYEDHPLPVAA